MTKPEFKSDALKNKEAQSLPGFVTDVESYTGRSERIEGFQKIKDAIVGVPGLRYVDPLILLEGAYNSFKSNSESTEFRQSVETIWDLLDGESHPLVVRRLFPDQNGNTKDGPRSGNITSPDMLFNEVARFYDFYDRTYIGQDVVPELMVHRVVDTANPPKIGPEPVLLPYPGGDVIHLGPNKLQVRATFGADESVQGFPADVWIVEFRPDGSTEIRQTVRANKLESHIPGVAQYRTIPIPVEFQETPALNLLQVHSLAVTCHNLSEKHGPHRLEFDQTRIEGEDVLVVIETAPFLIQENSMESVEEFKFGLTQPIMTFHSEQDFDAIPEDALLYAHIPNNYFRGNERRDALTRLAIIAKERGTKLVVLAAGNIATTHAGRVLTDNGHLLVFAENEQFFEGENIRVFTKRNHLLWEREDPIVLQDRMEGRGYDRVGGKAFGLRKLEEHGFETAPYFVLETSLFRRIMEETGGDSLLEGIDSSTSESAIRKLAKKIEQKILNFDFSKLPSIVEALQHIGGTKFAVRSSAICEDGKKSFAGIFLTRPNVEREELNQAILEVLASSMTEYAIRAAKVLDVKPSQLQMAVIIQKMVDSTKAGTIFTMDPHSGNENRLLIEATMGIGEGIVDGTATVRQKVVADKKSRAIKETSIYAAQNEILSESDTKRLIDLGLAIERKLKEGPQDIEWAIDSTGEITVLQSRVLST